MDRVERKAGSSDMGFEGVHLRMGRDMDPLHVLLLDVERPDRDAPDGPRNTRVWAIFQLRF